MGFSWIKEALVGLSCNELDSIRLKQCELVLVGVIGVLFGLVRVGFSLV